jgi:hypothetical protein
LTAISAISARSKLKSAEPSSPMSTWTIAGLPACRRSAILSLASVPLTISTPLLSFGDAALPGRATIADATATAVATATAEAASRTPRDFLSRVKFFIRARLLSK